MAKCAQRSAIYYFFALFLLFSSLTPVFGSGSRDAALSRADALINDKEYDEAILILSDFARQNPDKFDRAQSRLRRIYQIREDFNRTADELIRTLLNDPDNDDKILTLSLKLYSLEKDDSPLLTNFVSRTREIAQFNVSRNMLRNILERGRELLDRGDSVAAIQNYAGGMGIMREEFFSGDFGNETEATVIRETERVNTILEAFAQANAQAAALSAELTRAISAGDFPRITQSIDRLMPAIDVLAGLKHQLYSAVNTFERILEGLQANDPELGDRNHLAFLSIIIRGRTEETIQEGMLGAFDSAWRNSAGSGLNALHSYIEAANTSSLASFNAREYTPVISSLGRMESFYNLSGQFFAKHRQYFDASAPTVTLFANTVMRLDMRQFLELRALNEANNYLLQSANIAARQNIDRTSLSRWQQGSITTSEGLTGEQQVRSNINRMQRETENIAAAANQTNTQINSYHNVAHISNTLAAIGGLQAIFNQEELQSAQRYYTIAYNSLQNSLNVRKSEMERGSAYLEGERHTTDDGEAIVYYYPAEALVTLSSMISSSAIDLQNANTILTQFRNEPQPIASNAEITNLNTGYQAVYNELLALRNQGVASAEIARTRSSQAEAYRQEAERLYREAQTAYQRQDFDLARDRVQRSSDRIYNSLEIQASAVLRTTWDTQLLDLGQAISRAENEMIIAEVRNLVNNARTSYFGGNFQQAQDNLIRARSRWRVTNADDNDEVEYWLGIIRTALSARSGRSIPPTAPLFAEMSQLLSQAQRSFEEGMRHINAGQRILGLAKFDEARQMTREVRLMFPLNQQAGILDLRIEQFLDPAAFNTSFEQRMRTAIAGTRQRSIEAYADLQNLAEINPRYPNLRAILIQAEIDMGFRPPPPNPADIARSRELTASASRILDGNVTALFETALENIEQAITLNPENAEATRVKDRLLSRMSVPAAIVLTSQDEEIYQRAIRELQAGNNLVARALVERLMENPRNRNITKLVDLQRRIQSIL
ncbi:MAG: hypothetical protein FWD26_00525 [Treponema sp.]|nr:hypothetical protein [Treponema sp.]